MQSCVRDSDGVVRYLTGHSAESAVPQRLCRVAAAKVEWAGVLKAESERLGDVEAADVTGHERRAAVPAQAQVAACVACRTKCACQQLCYCLKLCDIN